jgi:hypothetical protein
VQLRNGVNGLCVYSGPEKYIYPSLDVLYIHTNMIHTYYACFGVLKIAGLGTKDSDTCVCVTLMHLKVALICPYLEISSHV